jgi:uncharacterized protein
MTLTTEQQTDANKQIAREFITALSEGRLSDAFDLTSPAGGIQLPHPRQRLPFGEWRKVYEALMESQFPRGCQYEIQAITAEDDRVAMVTESIAEMRTGDVYNNRYHWLFTFNDGLITECEEFMDSLYAYKTIHAAGWKGRSEE